MRSSSEMHEKLQNHVVRDVNLSYEARRKDTYLSRMAANACLCGFCRFSGGAWNSVSKICVKTITISYIPEIPNRASKKKYLASPLPILEQ